MERSAASNREAARNLAEGITLRYIDYLEAEIERLKKLCHTENAKRLF